MLVRFVAACCLAMSVIEIALVAAEFKYRGTPINIFSVVLWSLLFLVGLIILIRARAVADWLADKLDN